MSTSRCSSSASAGGRLVEERVFVDMQRVADFFGTEHPEDFFADL